MGKDVNICHHYWKSGVVLDYGINLAFPGAVRAGGLEQAELAGGKAEPALGSAPCRNFGQCLGGGKKLK